MDTPHATRGFCIQCGYALQGLPRLETGFRCPECGRTFDPFDPRTFRIHPHGQLLRRMATPVGWPAVILCLAAALAMLAISRWSLTTAAPYTTALTYYLHPTALRHRSNLITIRDLIFTLSTLTAIVCGLWWLIRSALRVFARWRMGADDQRPRLGRRHALTVLGLLIVSAAATLAWPYQFAQHWVAGQMSRAGKPIVNWPRAVITPPFGLSPPQIDATLRAAVIQLPQPRQRLTGLQLLIEGYPSSALPILMEAVVQEPDPEARALELLLIGLHRSSTTTDLLRGFLTHADARTRAAAADALGLLHAPAFEVSWAMAWPHGLPAATGSVSINLGRFIQLHALAPRTFPIGLPMNEIALDPAIRDALERMMLAGATPEEREAAARALLRWPPQTYKFRFAEWGVWIDDHGHLKLVQSVLDEIPPFVHRTGNPLSEFADRVNQMMYVTKPIIHITVDRPLAVDVNVVINRGRPWFAYPRPDDFAAQVETLYGNMGAPAPLSSLGNPQMERLAGLRQRYPWLSPPHVVSGSTSGSLGAHNELISLGLRWQSIIATPDQLPWMHPPQVGADERFAWWSRLRDVPASWLSSRGETERFLYYDGPTLAATPVKIEHKGSELTLRWKWDFEMKVPRSQTPAPWRAARPPHALCVRLREGQLTGEVIDGPAHWYKDDAYITHQLGEGNLHDDEVIAGFRSMLQAHGLTPAEADGLIACWRRQFFRTDGTRLLILMSRADYDALCPIQVRPTPTEMTRVGIILKELQPD